MLQFKCKPLGKLSKLKSGETWELVQTGDESPPPPPLKSTWDLFEAEWPPKNSSNQVEYEKYWYKINQYEWYKGIFGHV